MKKFGSDSSTVLAFLFSFHDLLLVWPMSLHLRLVLGLCNNLSVHVNVSHLIVFRVIG